MKWGLSKLLATDVRSEVEAGAVVLQARQSGELNQLDRCAAECWVCQFPVIWCSACGGQMFYCDDEPTPGVRWSGGEFYGCPQCGRGVSP